MVVRYLEQKSGTIYLKLGGSLITDKKAVRAARVDVIHQLAGEIREALNDNPGLQLIIGHGSGSFGHVSAREHGTRDGVESQEAWLGFIDVWRDADELNSIVMDALRLGKIPAMRFSPSSIIISNKHEPQRVSHEPIAAALSHGLVPVIYGDVVFDQNTGGTIYSTEEVFMALADYIPPARILIAGIERGVYIDYPDCQQLISEITPHNYPKINRHLVVTKTVDVTGGMITKVKLMLQLSKKYNGLRVSIFSGQISGNVKSALSGGSPGTTIHS